MVISATDQFLTSREKILQFLLVHCSASNSSCTVKDIASELDISVNAARQYLVILEKEGYVMRSQRKSKTGRPAITYSLHESALETFPKVYSDFSVKLLNEIKQKIGITKSVEILENVGRQIADEVRPVLKEKILAKKGSLNSLKDRLEGVAEIYQDYGKYPELLEDDDSYALKNFNCLIFGIAKEDPLVCKVDETIVTELIGTEAKKEKCLRDGDAYCLYRIIKERYA